MSTVETTLIDAGALHARLVDPSLVIIDARFNLLDVDAGRKAYLEAHIPGAVYAHLDEDLSGPPITDGGRHPLPSPEAIQETFTRLGVSSDSQVVAYDQSDGGVAARAWWLLRYMGHEAVAVLDGGMQAWLAAGHGSRCGEETRPAGRFRGVARREWLITVDQVLTVGRLVDARDPRRYRGEHEPLDPVAGHIPGAANLFYRDCVDDDGRFLPVDDLRDQFSRTLGGTPAAEAVFYCGSGVTACHNLLALCHAGLGDGRLYAGSWSEWCSNPARPVATGEAPASPGEA